MVRDTVFSILALTGGILSFLANVMEFDPLLDAIYLEERALHSWSSSAFSSSMPKYRSSCAMSSYGAKITGGGGVCS